jgi:hypothetical protein
MLRLIIYRVVRPAVATLMLWIEERWPNTEDVLDPDVPIDLWPVDDDGDDEPLADWLVRFYDGVPDDARELS